MLGTNVTITGASPATATRDLADPVEKKALFRQGERRYARYEIAIGLRSVLRVEIDSQGDLVERARG